MGRFEHIKYDQEAIDLQNHFKALVEQLEISINAIGKRLDPLVDKAFTGRSKALALTSLEETYMWIGKAIRDDQLARVAVEAVIKPK